MATGSYSHMFRVFNHEHGTEATLEASKQPTRWRTPAGTHVAHGPSVAAACWKPLSLPGPKLRFGRRGSAVARIQDGTDSPRKGGGAEGANGGASLGSDFPERLDYGSKLLHLAWSPSANVMAVAAANALYMFTGAQRCPRARSIAAHLTSDACVRRRLCGDAPVKWADQRHARQELPGSAATVSFVGPFRWPGLAAGRASEPILCCGTI
eukprot:scaffold659_cov329-Prasinococcus_capsulatus_cf.AAC.7